jgi:hypothetical protein
MIGDLARRLSPTGIPNNCISWHSGKRPCGSEKEFEESFRYSITTLGYRNRGPMLHTSGNWQTIGKRFARFPTAVIFLYISSAQPSSTEQQPPSREQ